MKKLSTDIIIPEKIPTISRDTSDCDQNEEYCSADYRFLHNDSNHGFYENEVWWPTVTHYIEAKKFRGTKYEDEIRNLSTPALVRFKTRERMGLNHSLSENNDSSPIDKNSTKESSLIDDIEPSKNKESCDYNLTYRKVYGITSDHIEIYKNERYSLLDIAIRSKFFYSIILLKLLNSTYPCKIKCPSDPDVASILNYIRSIYRKELFNKENNFPRKITSGSVRDMPTETNKDNRVCKLRNIIFNTAKKISRMEGWNKIFPEMVDDAISHICNIAYRGAEFQKAGKDVYSSFKSSEINNHNFDKSHPHFHSYVYQTRCEFASKDSYQTLDETGSLEISKFILYLLVSSNFEDVYKKAQIVAAGGYKNIIIVPGAREYRNKLPPKIMKNKNQEHDNRSEHKDNHKHSSTHPPTQPTENRIDSKSKNTKLSLVNPTNDQSTVINKSKVIDSTNVTDNKPMTSEKTKLVDKPKADPIQNIEKTNLGNQNNHVDDPTNFTKKKKKKFSHKPSHHKTFQRGYTTDKKDILPPTIKMESGEGTLVLEKNEDNIAISV